MPFRRNYNSKFLIQRYFQTCRTMEGVILWPCGNAGGGDCERAKAWVFVPAVRLALLHPSYGRPSFLQDTILHMHNSTHLTQHGTSLYGHKSTPHIFKHSQLDTAQLNTPQLDMPQFGTSQLDTTQLYKTTTRHTTTLHGHNSTLHNSTQTTWPYG